MRIWYIEWELWGKVYDNKVYERHCFTSIGSRSGYWAEQKELFNK